MDVKTAFKKENSLELRSMICRCNLLYIVMFYKQININDDYFGICGKPFHILRKIINQKKVNN